MKVQLENLVLHMYKSGLRYSEAVREFQKAFILAVLQETNGNQVRAARKLRIHRNSLGRIIQVRRRVATAGQSAVPNLEL